MSPRGLGTQGGSWEAPGPCSCGFLYLPGSFLFPLNSERTICRRVRIFALVSGRQRRVQGSSPGKQKPSLWLQDSGSICSSHVTSGKRLHLSGLCHLGDGRPLQSCSLQSHRQIQRYIETPWAPQLSWGSAIRTQSPFSDAPGSSYLRPGSREELQISSHWDDGHTYTRLLSLRSTSLPTTGSHGA